MNLYGDVDAPEEVPELPRWPHQRFAVEEVFRLIERGCRRILVTSPTGGGKTLMMKDLIRRAWRENGWGVTLFANRKMLVDQMIRSLKDDGMDYGVRAADHVRNSYEPFQIASIQTEYSRVVKKKAWVPHPCGLYIVDEAHVNDGTPQTKSVYDLYGATAVKVGFTATPLGLSGHYDELVQAGTTGQLRECGALVAAEHFGCTEPDLANIRRYQIGEDLSEPDNVKAIMAPGIHGRVLEHYRRLNPQGLPAIGFAPGVGESLGFAEKFVEAGIPAAHIDGDRVWINGEWLPSTEESRAQMLELSRTGQVRVVWNRFVLREAVDMPWLRHGIFATVFGSLQSYLQSGGRLLRACPQVGKTGVTVQDHGGNWWRHGSLNADRVWRLTDTARLLAQVRADRIAGDADDGPPDEPEPFLCPACNTVLVLRTLYRHGLVTCPRCGHEMDFNRRSRPVVQADGELVEHPGNIFQRRRVELRDDTARKWRNYYFRARNSNMTFSQAAGLFCRDNGYFPPRTLPLMPMSRQQDYDWYLPVKSVPFDRLRPENREAHDA